MERSGLVTPTPVAVRLAGGIHTSRAVQTQYVLERDNRHGGNRTKGQAYQVPGQFGTFCPPQIA